MNITQTVKNSELVQKVEAAGGRVEYRMSPLNNTRIGTASFPSGRRVEWDARQERPVSRPTEWTASALTLITPTPTGQNVETLAALRGTISALLLQATTNPPLERIDLSAPPPA